MNKYKIAVYAICKNEEKFAERWMNSMKEADAVYVADTGSTDHSAETLRKLGHETDRLNSCRRITISASAPIWTRFLNPAGGRSLKRYG